MSLKKPCAIKFYTTNQPTKNQKQRSNEYSEQWAEEYKLSPKFAECLNEGRKFAECEAVTQVCFLLFQKRTDEFNEKQLLDNLAPRMINEYISVVRHATNIVCAIVFPQTIPAITADQPVYFLLKFLQWVVSYKFREEKFIVLLCGFIQVNVLKEIDGLITFRS